MRNLSFVAIFLIGGVFIFFLFSFLIPPKEVFVIYKVPSLFFWHVQSIDTMKYSRDLSREKMNDPDFDKVIDRQVKDIAAIGATHVAITTPYDEEFIPILERWVSAARKYKLKVWFRGNLSGWEKWFEYNSITRDDHIKLIKDFIIGNSGLFEDGDIFSSCPECENGGQGDPREINDVTEYRKFLIKEYQTSKSAFRKIEKQVSANYFSMNGDVAKLIMDKETTAALDGIVVIDHYMKNSEAFVKDIDDIAAQSGGKIVLGEFGAPIHDIHGEMTPKEQAQWISNLLTLLARSINVIGVNYWVNVGGSTEIWDSKGNQLPGADIIREFYNPEVAYGTITDSLDCPIAGAEISNSAQTVFTDKNGYFEIPVIKSLDANLIVSAENYLSENRSIKENTGVIHIKLAKERKDILLRIRMFFKNIIK